MYTKDLPYHRLSVLNIFFHIYIYICIYFYAFHIYTWSILYIFLYHTYLYYTLSMPPHCLCLIIYWAWSIHMIYTHDPYTWTILSSIYTLHYLYFALSIYRLSLHNTRIHFLGNIYTLPVSYLYIICTLYIYIFVIHTV